MKHHITAIFIILLIATLRTEAAVEPDSVIRDVEQCAQAIKSVSIDSCHNIAQTWVEGISGDDLLAYTAYAENIMYTPYCTQQERIVYRTLLARLLQSGMDELRLLRYRYQYEQLSHNNEGERAIDFTYYDINDNSYLLSQHIGNKTLIIFNDPGCEECAILRQHIITQNEIGGETIDSTTTVIIIYPDLPTDEWREAVSHYPAHWIVGYSDEVIDLYDLRTLPSTYILDTQHIILQRNTHTYITDKL